MILFSSFLSVSEWAMSLTSNLRGSWILMIKSVSPKDSVYYLYLLTNLFILKIAKGTSILKKALPIWETSCQTQKWSANKEKVNTRKLKFKNLSKKYRIHLTLECTFLSKTKNSEAIKEKMDRFDIIKIKISLGQQPSNRLKGNILRI